jgi:hypothetical protein
MDLIKSHNLSRRNIGYNMVQRIIRDAALPVGPVDRRLLLLSLLLIILGQALVHLHIVVGHVAPPPLPVAAQQPALLVALPHQDVHLLVLRHRQLVLVVRLEVEEDDGAPDGGAGVDVLGRQRWALAAAGPRRRNGGGSFRFLAVPAASVRPIVLGGLTLG